MKNAIDDTNPEPSSPFVGESMHIAARAVLCTLGTLMILCGVTGSGLLITVIFRRFRRKRHVHDLFLASLALGDCLLLGYGVSSLVLDLVLGFHPVVNQAHCVANGMVVYTLNVVCIISLLGISLNRYLHVCHSQLCQRFFTLPRTVGVLATIWTVGVLVALPPALGLERGFYHYSPHTHVCSFSRQGISYAQVMVMLFTSAPMVVIGACNFAIFRFWKKARMSLDKWKAGDGQGKVLGKRAECVKKSRDMEVSWDPNKDHVVPGSEGEVSVVSVDESRDTVGPERHDSPTGRLANNVEGLGEEIEHPQIMHSSDDDSMGNKDCNSAASLSSIEANSRHKTAHSERDPQKSKINLEHNEAKIISENDPVSARKQPPKHKSEFGAVALDVTRNSLTAPSNSPSASSLSSLGRTQKRTATRNRPHHLVATAAQNRHPQKQQQHAREVAFVRSLFVVFLLTGITFLPYLIIMALSSKVHVPSEIVVLGLLILYVNNSVNWIVYGVMNPSFRKAYSQCGQQLLGMCRQSRAERTDRQHTYSMSSVTAPRQNGAR